MCPQFVSWEWTAVIYGLMWLVLAVRAEAQTQMRFTRPTRLGV